MNPNHGVYVIVNTVNDKVYIGQTKQGFAKRWYQHVKKAQTYGYDAHFMRAIRKHGAENFRCAAQLHIGDGLLQRHGLKIEDALNNLEKGLIACLQSWKPENGYNSSMGGDCGGTPTPESLRKRSVARLGFDKNTLKKQIIRDYKSGMTAREIAAQLTLGGYELSNYTIGRCLKEWGIQIRPLSETTTGLDKEKHKQEIIRQYESGKSTRDIAKQFDIDSNTIRAWLGTWGVKIRDLSESHCGVNKEDHKKAIIKAYRQGKSTLEIARDLGLADCVIGLWLKGWGIKRRTHAENNRRRGERTFLAIKNQLVAGYKEGKSNRQLASELRVEN